MTQNNSSWEEEFNKYFCDEVKGMWRDDIITPNEMIDFFRTKWSEAFEEGKKVENKAWIEGSRCLECGKEKEKGNTCSMCDKCLEEK